MKLNRRTALGVLGAMGAASAASAPARGLDLPSPIPLPPAPVGRGVRGRMTGACAAVAALRAEGVRVVYGVPGTRTTASGTR